MGFRYWAASFAHQIFNRFKKRVGPCAWPITACYSVLRHLDGLRQNGLAKNTDDTILENNCMQSTASSAGYSTGGTLVSAFAAFIMLNGHALSVPLTPRVGFFFLRHPWA